MAEWCSRISARRGEPFVRVGRGHADVHDRHVRLVHGHVTQQVVCVVRLGDDVEAGLGEQPHDALAQQHRVVRDDDAHRVPEHRDRVAQRREVAREPFGEQLVDVLRVRQAGETVRAEIARRDVGQRRVGGGRDEDLPAVAGRADPGGPMDVDPRVAVLREERLAGVDAHADADVVPLGPLVLDEGALCRHRRRGCRVRVGEDGEELVAVRVDLVPSVRRHGFPEDAALVRQDLRIRQAGLVHEAGRPLDVAQQEADGAVARRAHGTSLRGRGPASAAGIGHRYRSKKPTTRRSYSAGRSASPPVWCASGISQYCFGRPARR